MIKFQLPNKHQILKSTIFILFGYWLLVIGISSVQAQTATNSADTIRDSVKQKVTEELAQIKKGVAKKGYVGSISAISDGNVTINSFMLQPRKALVAADTAIKLANGSDGTPGDLKVGLYVLAMGDVDSQDTMTAKRLLIIPKPDTDNRIIIFGQILKSTTSTFTVGSDTYKYTAATKFANKSKATDLTVGSKVVAVINNGTATRILISSAAPASTPVPAASSSASPKP